jgi:putative copper resistance protein D
MENLFDLSRRRRRPILAFGFFLIVLIASIVFHVQETRSETTHDVHSMHAGNPMPGSPEDVAYSEFMHRLNGVFVFLLGSLAVLERRWVKASGFLRWGWPALFLISGVYLMVQSDQDGWPIGEKGFIESMRDPTIFQHKIAASILLLLGLSELLLRTSRKVPVLGWVFPALAVSAGVLLFFHAHGGHHIPKIYLQHLFMGGTALAIGVTRGISKKFKAGDSLWPLMILLLGLELLFYTE